MKKTLTINLAGIVFHIDEDAYDRLREFLNRLDYLLSDEQNKAEIISDIEARIAELFNMRLTNTKQVVVMKDVDDVIKLIGDPEVISGKENSNSYTKEGRKYRRIYRDSDHRIVSGVCSGLAAYWNMDPTLVRAVFVIMTFIGGSGIIIYLVLLIILPEAQTTAQKLEMRGEPVTIESIKNFFSTEFENVKRNFRK